MIIAESLAAFWPAKNKAVSGWLYARSLWDPGSMMNNIPMFVAAGLAVIILVTEITLTAKTREWPWFLYLLIPPPLALIFLLIGGPSSFGSFTYRVSVTLFAGTVMTWIFLMLVFTLAGAVRKG